MIAIVAILASILFPVFAQAKEAAKKTSCLSNLKQLGVAWQMYGGDYDDMATPAWFSNGGGATDAVSGPWPVQFNQGYIKSREFLVCPSFKNGAGMYSIYEKDGGLNYYRDTTYGYNATYLNPAPGCPDGPDSPGSDTLNKSCATSTMSANAGLPVSLTAFGDAANTLAFTESTIYVAGQGFVGSYYYVKPPSMWAGYNPADSTTWKSDSFGRVLARHGGQIANVSFADGHAKGLKLDALRKQDLWRVNKIP